MILTYKYKLKGKRTVRQLRRYSYACNQVWNYCVSTHKNTQKRWKNGSKTHWLSHFDLIKLTKNVSKDLGISAQSVQNVCAQFTKSRDQHKKCPRFRKSSGSKRNLGWIPFQKHCRQIKNNSITYLGNTYRFFGLKRRPLPVVVKGGAFVEDSQGQWYVTLCVEVNKLPSGYESVGIDLGLKTLATLSTSEKIEAPKTYRKYQEKLATAQRASNNKRVKAIHAKIKNIRQDHLHKESNKIAKKYGLVVVGNVNSAKLAKTKMAKSVLDASWSTFRNFLQYKVSRHEGKYLEVDEKFTTQRCSSCQKITDNSPKGMNALGIREWVCSNCKTQHDRDVNAAKNILKLGLSAQPHVDESQKSIEKLRV